MRPGQFYALLVLGFLSVAARGDVTDATAIGFSLVHEVTIDASRPAVWAAAIDDVGHWWNEDHTVAGVAGALSIDAVPLGCFCEALANDDGVVHMTITFVNTNVILRLTGGLGPLGLMGVSGNMTWEFFDADNATKVRFSYAVGGYRPGGLDDIAAPVDFVIGEALRRLKSYIETGSPEPVSDD